MRTGKLYKFSDEQFVVDINYQLLGETPTNFWGELVPNEYASIGGVGDYMLELDDNRKIKCHLKKRVNRAVIGIPPRYIYHFAGMALPG
jgi:hypothetical protein